MEVASSFMFGRQERLAILLLITVAVVVTAAHLTLGYVGKRPFCSPYSVQSQDGDLVYVSGTIDEISITRAGSHGILTIDNITVFLPNSVMSGFSFAKGITLTVIGTVQTYQGKKEVVVQSASDIAFAP